MSEATKSQLAEVFQVVLELPADADLSALRRGETAGWDSLGHVTLMTAIASEFDVEITAVDSLDVTSFEAAASLLEELLDE